LHTSDVAIALTIGVTLSLLFSEISGMLPGGLVVPGYLAISWNRPVLILVILATGLLTNLLVGFLGKFVILYGRRKFAAMLLMGIGLTLVVELILPLTPLTMIQLRSVGIVVPGLLANCIHRQGLLPTLTSLAILISLTVASLALYQHYF
jgi:poly-gamma-glutamate biosynthesis protein PgsC/CapC